MRFRYIASILLYMVCHNSLHAQLADSLYKTTDSLQLRKDTTATAIADTIYQDFNEHKYAYTIRGVVRDKSTGIGIPYATVFFPGSAVGTAADEDGNFSLGFDKLPGDSLRAEAIGYTKFRKKMDRNKHDYQMMIELSLSASSLNEVVVHAGEDPAIVLFKRVIKAKPYNNPDHTSSYRYEAYNKIEVDIAQLSKKTFRYLPVPMLRKFSFIYDKTDSTSGEKPFLPFYLTESLSDYYFQRHPKKEREFIKAAQVKGLENQSITKYLGSVYQNINPYRNYIPIFDKRFVSPITDDGLFFYKYKIQDTQQMYGYNIIHMTYEARRAAEQCFNGDLWIVDSIFALQAINMVVPKDVNLNWTKKLSIYQSYAPIDDNVWFCVKDQFEAEFTAPYNIKLPMAIGHKTTTYRNIVVDDSVTERVFNDPSYKQDVIVSDSARTKSNEYWAEARHEPLSKNEKAIYHNIDTLESMKSFRHFKNFMRFVISGVERIGPIELGPYWYLYSSNPVEGPRVRFSMGTTQKLFKDAYFNGYVAYGFKDQRFKYNINGLWLLDRNPRMYFYGSYTSDIDIVNNYYSDANQVSADNLFSMAVRKPGIPWKLAFSKRARFEFYKQYFSGFSHEINFEHWQFTPYAPLPAIGIFTNSDGSSSDHVTNAELGLHLRYAWKEKFLEGKYWRFSMGSRYPIVNLEYGHGMKGLWGSSYEYDKVRLSVSGRVKIPPLGILNVSLYGGKYWGNLPYPLLERHPGNENYYYSPFAFSMMNRYEFISDQYVGLNLEHNIGGGIFNYIPYLKKLKLRQFWTAKSVIGSLSDANKQLNLNKGYEFRTLQGNPYLELGTGVENILQIFRIDFVWRVTPKPLPIEDKSHYFGIFGSVKFQF